MSEELEDIDETLLDVDPETGEVVQAVIVAPDANLARTIRGSVSLIKAYQQCPAQAYGRITRQKQTKTMALVNGIAVHEALEDYIKLDKEPQKRYDDVLKFEAERNEVSLSGTSADEARKVGRECIGAAVSILGYEGTTGVPLKERMDKDLVEVGFSVERGGRLYVGKMDFAVFKKPTVYTIGDWKTGKNSPSPYELKTDLQFTMYPWAAFHDRKLKTFGLWATSSVYMHLRGASQEKDANGRTVPKNRTKKPLKYDFPTERTPEFVEYQFVTTIEPIMESMEQGRFYRVEGKNCSYCGFYNKDKERCEVEIPADALLAQQNQLSLIGATELTESKRAGLKPYTDRSK